MGQNLLILQGDCRERMRELPDESVQCCVTSPPYWGLRSYLAKGHPLKGCEIGLEESPEEYLAKMVAVFREVRRVLKKDGTCWINMGDCYATGGGAVGRCPGGGERGERFLRQGMINTQPNRMPLKGYKPKDLVGVPWMLAFALRADGWYLRADIIWHKPNPMPESVRDRPTKAHEYLFLLSRTGKYYYDRAAIREPVTGGAHPRGGGVNPKSRVPAGWDTGPGSHREKTGRYKTPGRNSRVFQDRDAKHKEEPKRKQNESFSSAVKGLVENRNKRSVWTIATRGFAGSHFATFPPELVRPCVLAGTRVGDTVLDPFGGSGTVAEVALELGRSAVVIELNPDYMPLIEERTRVMGLL